MPHPLRTFNALLWLLVLGHVALGVAVAPVIYPDTPSYLDHAVTRAPMYPLLLNLARLAVGEHWPRVIVLLQGVVAGLAVRHFVLVLRAHFRLPDLVALALGALVSLPQLSWIPALLTESLCHSVFLVLTAQLVVASMDTNVWPFARASALLALLLAIRPHYLFIAPGLLLFAVAFAWRHRAALLGLRLAALVIAAVLAGSGAQILGNWLANDAPVRTAALGMHAAAVQLYLATPDEAHLFDGDPDALVAHQIWPFMQQERLFFASVPGMTDLVDGFSQVYDVIIYGGLVPQARARAGLTAMTTAQWLRLDRATTRLAKVLAAHHPLAYARHVAAQLRGALPLLLLVLAAMAVGVWHWLRRARHTGLVLATTAVLVLGNHLELALVQVTRLRYVMTTDLVFVVVVVALLCVEDRAEA